MTGQIGWYILGRIRIRIRMRPISLNDRIRSILLNTALTFSTVSLLLATSWHASCSCLLTLFSLFFAMIEWFSACTKLRRAQLWPESGSVTDSGPCSQQDHFGSFHHFGFLVFYSYKLLLRIGSGTGSGWKKSRRSFYIYFLQMIGIGGHRLL
jgi:hypothetical protein